MAKTAASCAGARASSSPSNANLARTFTAPSENPTAGT